jgi:hypothetical protein
MKHTVGKVIVPATLTEVFAVPAGYKAQVSTLFASNHQGNNKWITLYWQHAHDANHKIYVVTEFVISANNYLQFSDSMVMQVGILYGLLQRLVRYECYLLRLTYIKRIQSPLLLTKD